MPWQSLWPDFLKKRLCRYLLQHYLGHFFKEKISLEQLSIDIYNGTGCVKNLNLDCDALNEQLNSTSATSPPGATVGGPAASATSSAGPSSIPIEIVSGFVGYISVYIPWHDLFNDYCKLTIKNVQIIIRVKQPYSKQRAAASFGHLFRPMGARSSSAPRREDEDDDGSESFNELDEEDGSESDDPFYDTSTDPEMLSSMFIDSIMNTSMHIAQECLNESSEDEESIMNKSSGSSSGANNNNSNANSNNNSLLGLEAFASTIDSILSRIKINLEQIHIRIENLDQVCGSAATFGPFNTSSSTINLNDMLYSSNVMNSSTFFNNKPSNGIALELRIKSIKYFDVDSTMVNAQSQQSGPSIGSTNSSAANSLDHEQAGRSLPGQQQSIARNTTKSFNIEGLTVYFDEFIVRDDYDLNENNPANFSNTLAGNNNNYNNLASKSSSNMMTKSETSLNSTIELSEDSTTPENSITGSGVGGGVGSSSISSSSSSMLSSPSPVKPSQPTDEAAPFNFELNSDYYLYSNPIIMLTFGGTQSIKLSVNNLKPMELIMDAGGPSTAANQQRPSLELSAQFGSIKCLLCPKQIHLLTEMCKKVTDYVDSVAQHKRTLKFIQQRQNMARRRGMKNMRGKLGRRGSGKPIRGYYYEDDEDEDELLMDEEKQPGNANNIESSSMFYSMMSESTTNSQGFAETYNSQHHTDNLNATTTTTILDTSMNEPDLKSSQNSEDSDQTQSRLMRERIHHTIDELKNDIIVVNHKSKANLFQTFKLKFRMLTLTVLHTDPTINESSTGKQNQHQPSHQNNQNSKFLLKNTIVDRMKSIADNYFDQVSTIETTGVNSSSASSMSIDKTVIVKYHQACAFNDHFLILLKPINVNLVQKINQHHHSHLTGGMRRRTMSNGGKFQRYSLNDLQLSIGYLQFNEYLINEKIAKLKSSPSNTSYFFHNNSNRYKYAHVIEAAQTASITELLYFESSGGDSTTIDQQQPCVRIDLVFYEPLSGSSSTSTRKSSNQKATNKTSNLLGRSFENISIQLNHALMLELDISIIDRLYYLMNDITKSNRSAFPTSTSAGLNNNPNATATPANSMTNVEVKCSQLLKVALRFPIADLRQNKANNSTNTAAAPATQQTGNTIPVTPTMIAFKRLRPQILTLHIFDFNFLTVLNAPNGNNNNQVTHEQTLLTFTTSQINMYYQYAKKERPIHFALVQQASDSMEEENRRSHQPILFSIRLPAEQDPISVMPVVSSAGASLSSEFHGLSPTEHDSLKHIVNRANRFFHRDDHMYSRSISDQTEPFSDEKENRPESRQDDGEENEEDDDDEDESEFDEDDDEDGDDQDAANDNKYGPFSKIHSLISSEKNRRIVNAANKQEMHTFIQQSLRESQMIVKINLPVLKCLISDQKFLNDIYNCFLNDLIMWEPSRLPPIESLAAINGASLFSTNPASLSPPSHIMTESNILQEADLNTDKKFYMCRSAIYKSPNNQELNVNSQGGSMATDIGTDTDTDHKSDDDKLKRKLRDKKSNLFGKYGAGGTVGKTKIRQKIQNKLCLVINIDNTHLKSFVLVDGQNQANIKYGEFDIKANNFRICIVSAESFKSSSSPVKKSKMKPKYKKLNEKSNLDSTSNSSGQRGEKYKIEKQYIGLYSDQISIGHSTKTTNNSNSSVPGSSAPNTATAASSTTGLKYPTNYSSFESLFQTSRTRDLIYSNDANINKTMFSGATSASSSNNDGFTFVSASMGDSPSSMGSASSPAQPVHSSASPSSTSVIATIPMISIGIKSKFNSKTNIKQLLVALNFNNLTLNHLFSTQPDFWVVQLIDLFDLVDIDVLGYEVPLVITELHLNVTNSCIVYNPVHLPTRSLVTFKSLHWSSNVTPESSLTLLVFNIEDIYLFLSRVMNQSELNLKRDYVCVANSDLFELRLLINDETRFNQPVVLPRKSPILDIKIRSNLIQLRTCHDSAFALIELINYIVNDGDLFQLSTSPPIVATSSESGVTINMNANNMPMGTGVANTNNQSVIDELSSAIGGGSSSEAASSFKSSSSIPINKLSGVNMASSPSFTVGTPPVNTAAPASFKSSSSSNSLQHHHHPNVYYSPNNSNNVTINNNLTNSPAAALPAPSLSFAHHFKGSLNESSSAESLISDMVKEAMTTTTTGLDHKTSIRPPSDLMTTSVYGLTFGAKSDEEDDDDDEVASRRPTLIGSRDDNLTSDLLDSTSTNKTINKYLKDSDEDDEEHKSDENVNASSSSSFQFDMPFSDMSPMGNFNRGESSSSKKKQQLSGQQQHSVQRKLTFSRNPSMTTDDVKSTSGANKTRLRKLYFNSRLADEDDDYNREFGRGRSDSDDDGDETESGDDEKELLKDFDIIDVIPGFGEPPKSNTDYEIKLLRKKTSNHVTQTTSYRHYSSPPDGQQIEIKEDHFKKPLSKIDVLKAPDNYPCPLNSYCVQEISLHWFLYGGYDFLETLSTTNGSNSSDLAGSNDSDANKNSKMSRTVSSPIMVNNPSSVPVSQTLSQAMAAQQQRSRNNSQSSNSFSMSPHSLNMHTNPYYQHGNSPGSPQQYGQVAKFSTKTASLSMMNNRASQSVLNSNNSLMGNPQQAGSAHMQRKAGGRLINKYDLNSLNWLNRGGRNRNLDLCMEIALHKAKVKVDIYNDQATLNSQEKKQQQSDEKDSSQQPIVPYLYRIALAIGDVEIRDKIATSPFNMFLFRYESEQCPKHTNSNMIFFKFICSKSMDSQQLLECDMKLSIQPLRFNIDQDALIFLVEFFTKMGSRDLNEFSKNLTPPPPPTPITVTVSPQSSEHPSPFSSPSNPSGDSTGSQQIFIRNFIFSPDLLIKFDFSGKYDNRPGNKLDTVTKLLMVVVQLSNTEIKLKRVYYRRGFLGVEKLAQTLVREWIGDIQRNQMKNLIKGWGIFNSVIQFFEGFTYLVWYPIDQYKRDGRVLCGLQKGSAAFSTCTVLATIELTNRMFQATKNVAEFFYDLVTPHRAGGGLAGTSPFITNNMIGFVSTDSTSSGGANNLMDTLLTGSRHIRIRRQPNDIREGLTNAYYVMYEGLNDTASNFMQEINQGAEHKGLPGAIGGALRQLPSAALAPIVLATDATCNILSGIRNQLKPDEKKDDDQKWKKITFS